MSRTDPKTPIVCIDCETADLVMFGELSGRSMVECPHCLSPLMTLSEFVAMLDLRDDTAAGEEALS